MENAGLYIFLFFFIIIIPRNDGKNPVRVGCVDSKMTFGDGRCLTERKVGTMHLRSTMMDGRQSRNQAELTGGWVRDQ